MNNSNQQQPFFNLFVLQALLQYQLLTMVQHQSNTPIMEPFRYGSPPHIPTMAHQQDQNRASTSSHCHNRRGRRSDVPARLGLKAAALARPEPAPAFSKAGPGQSRQTRLGPGPARLKPRLLAEKTIIFSYCRKTYLRHVRNSNYQVTMLFDFITVQ